MVKRYHESFPSFSYGFDSRYPLHGFSPDNTSDNLCFFRSALSRSSAYPRIAFETARNRGYTRSNLT